MHKFEAKISIIGINPFVEVPNHILEKLQKEAKKDKGPIPIKGNINGKPFIQTVVKFQNLWRLYLNTPMRKDSDTTVGDTATFEIEYDSIPRIVPTPKVLQDELSKNKTAKDKFKKLPPYRQKEISRYINSLKSEQALKRNVENVIKYLTGQKVEGILFFKRKNN